MSNEASKQDEQNCDKKKKDKNTLTKFDCYNKRPKHELDPKNIKETFFPRNAQLFNYNIG